MGTPSNQQGISSRSPDSLFNDLKSQYINLEKQHNKQTERLETTKLELKKFQSMTAALQKEENTSKSVLSKINAQKQTLDKELEDLKMYARKLEHRVAMGATGHYLADLNFHLQEKLKNLRAENGELTIRVESLTEDKSSLKQKVHNLSISLNKKAEELGVEQGGSVLYEITVLRKEVAQRTSAHEETRKLLEEASTQLEQCLVKMEEQEVIGESNNQELERLETEHYALVQENTGLRENNQVLVKDRLYLLDSIEKMSGSAKQSEMELEEKQHDMKETEGLYRRELEEKHREIEGLHQTNNELFQRMNSLEQAANNKSTDERRFQNAISHIEKLQEANDNRGTEIQELQQCLKTKDAVIAQLKDALGRQESAGRRLSGQGVSTERVSEPSRKLKFLGKSPFSSISTPTTSNCTAEDMNRLIQSEKKKNEELLKTLSI